MFTAEQFHGKAAESLILMFQAESHVPATDRT